MLLQRARAAAEPPRPEDYLEGIKSNLGQLIPNSLRLPLRDPSKSSVAAWLHPTRHTLAKQAVPNDGLCAYTCILKGLDVAHSKLPEAALALRLYYVDLLTYVFTHPDYLLIDGMPPVTDLLGHAKDMHASRCNTCTTSP